MVRKCGEEGATKIWTGFYSEERDAKAIGDGANSMGLSDSRGAAKKKIGRWLSAKLMIMGDVGGNKFGDSDQGFCWGYRV